MIEPLSKFVYASSGAGSVLLSSDAAIPKMRALLLRHSIDVAFVNSDVMSIIREGRQLGHAFTELSGASSSARHFFADKYGTLGNHAFGSATGISGVVGFVQMIQRHFQARYAESIGDKRGSLMGRIGAAVGASLCVAGLSFAVYRPLSMAEVIKGSSKASLLGRVAYASMASGLVFYSVFFALFSVVFGIQIYEGLDFKKKLSQAKDSVEFLKRKLIDPETSGEQLEAFYKKLVEKKGYTDEKLFNEGIAAAKTTLRALMKELNIQDVGEEKLGRMLKSILGDSYEQDLMLMGLHLKVQTVGLKKLAKMERVLDAKGLEALQALVKGDRSEGLVDQIKAGNRFKLLESGGVLTVLAFGIGAMLLPLIFTAGTAALISSIIMFVFILGMMAVDGYFLKKSFDEARPTGHDKKMLLFSSLVAVASFGAVIGLGLSGVVSMGIVPLVVSIVLLAIWLSQNGVTWAVMERNERRYREKNPAIEPSKEEKELELEHLREMLMPHLIQG